MNFLKNWGGPWKGSKGWSMEGAQGVVHGLGVSVFNSPVGVVCSSISAIYVSQFNVFFYKTHSLVIMCSLAIEKEP